MSDLTPRALELIADFVSDVSVDAEIINESLWYVHPRDIELRLKSYIEDGHLIVPNQ